MTTDHLRQSVEMMDRRAAILRVTPSSMSMEVGRDELAALLAVCDAARETHKRYLHRASKHGAFPLSCDQRALGTALAKLDEVKP